MWLLQIITISGVVIPLIIGQSYNANKQITSIRSLPKTKFTCDGRASGYYADVETGCQIYHMCDGMGRQFTHECPDTTLFHQRMLVCDHWYMVNCSRAEHDYSANLLIGQKDKSFLSEADHQLRTPRPDLLDRPYAADYSGESYRQFKNKFPAIQNAIAGVNYKKSVPIHKVSSAEQSNTFQHQNPLPIQWSTKSKSGITTSLPILQDFDNQLKQNDRRNVKGVGTLPSLPPLRRRIDIDVSSSERTSSNENTSKESSERNQQQRRKSLDSRESGERRKGFDSRESGEKSIPRNTSGERLSKTKQGSSESRESGEKQFKQTQLPTLQPKGRKIDSPSMFYEPPLLHPQYNLNYKQEAKKLQVGSVTRIGSGEKVQIFPSPKPLPPLTTRATIPTTTTTQQPSIFTARPITTTARPITLPLTTTTQRTTTTTTSTTTTTTTPRPTTTSTTTTTTTPRPTTTTTTTTTSPITVSVPNIQTSTTTITPLIPISLLPPLQPFSAVRSDVKVPSADFEPPSFDPVYTQYSVNPRDNAPPQSQNFNHQTQQQVQFPNQNINQQNKQNKPQPNVTPQPLKKTSHSDYDFSKYFNRGNNQNSQNNQNNQNNQSNQNNARNKPNATPEPRILSRPITQQQQQQLASKNTIDQDAFNFISTPQPIERQPQIQTGFIDQRPPAFIEQRPAAFIEQRPAALPQVAQSLSIPQPASDLLPPFEIIKTYDDSTTQGPPIYYEWKWSIPAQDLEPPKTDAESHSDASNRAGKTTNEGVNGNQQENGALNNNQRQTQMARSATFNSREGETKSQSGATAQSRSDEPEYNYRELQKKFFIPDYQFPLESSETSTGGSVNSFQIKIPETISTDKRWYGENQKCPECHPAYTKPGTCEPCIRLS